MQRAIRAPEPRDYVAHRLHDGARSWPLSNCYIDLWIELLATAGRSPEAMLSFAVALDFEGDQFTFAKPGLDDLRRLYGVTVQELAVYDRIEAHLETQIARGRPCLVEVDSYFLPDTQGLSYRLEHGKTTVAVNALSSADRRMEYFHNGGYYALEGADYDGLTAGYAHGDTPFLPYAEFVKFDAAGLSEAALRAEAWRLLAQRLTDRPKACPISAFQAQLPAAAARVAGREPGFFHLYAFNSLRQLGADFELLGDHLVWLDPAMDDLAGFARAIAQSAKAVQFKLARACAKKKFEGLETSLDSAVAAYGQLMAGLEARVRAAAPA